MWKCYLNPHWKQNRALNNRILPFRSITKNVHMWAWENKQNKCQRWSEKKKKIISLYCRYSGWRQNVPSWLRKVTWKMETMGRTWSWSVFWDSWPKSLVAMLTTCLLVHNSAFSVMSGVLKSRQCGSWHFYHAIVATFMSGSFYITSYSFWRRDLFCDTDLMLKPLAQIVTVTKSAQSLSYLVT